MVNRKAQSQIITTILIILLVLAAIIIVWQVVQGTITEGANEIEDQSKCLGLRVDITNVNTDTSSITIRPTEEISGYNVYINGADFASSTDTVSALNTATATNAGVTLTQGDEIEVIPLIGDVDCQGFKQTVK